jgi:hypothetical protein
MVDLKCRLGESIQIGDQYLVRLIAIRSDCVLLRLISQDDDANEGRDITLQNEREEFRHSE